MASAETAQTLNCQVMLDLIGDDQNKIKQFQIDFLSQANIYYKKLVACFNQSQFSQIKEHAHFLKTSANAIGAEKTGYFLASIEEYALKQDKPALKQLILKLRAELKLLALEINQ